MMDDRTIYCETCADGLRIPYYLPADPEASREYARLHAGWEYDPDYGWTCDVCRNDGLTEDEPVDVRPSPFAFRLEHDGSDGWLVTGDGVRLPVDPIVAARLCRIVSECAAWTMRPGDRVRFTIMETGEDGEPAPRPASGCVREDADGNWIACERSGRYGWRRIAGPDKRLYANVKDFAIDYEARRSGPEADGLYVSQLGDLYVCSDGVWSLSDSSGLHRVGSWEDVLKSLPADGLPVIRFGVDGPDGLWVRGLDER